VLSARLLCYMHNPPPQLFVYCDSWGDVDYVHTLHQHVYTSYTSCMLCCVRHCCCCRVCRWDDVVRVLPPPTEVKKRQVVELDDTKAQQVRHCGVCCSFTSTCCQPSCSRCLVSVGQVQHGASL
jgi:hypothetical protein